jgi:hypothetical protein
VVATRENNTIWVTQLSWIPRANAGVPWDFAAWQNASSSVHVLGAVSPALVMASVL